MALEHDAAAERVKQRGNSCVFSFSSQFFAFCAAERFATADFGGGLDDEDEVRVVYLCALHALVSCVSLNCVCVVAFEMRVCSCLTMAWKMDKQTPGLPSALPREAAHAAEVAKEMAALGLLVSVLLMCCV